MKFRNLVLVLVTFTSVNGVGAIRADEPVKEKTTLKGHTKEVHALAFSPDGKTLASGSYDRTIGLWDLETFGEKLISPKNLAEYGVVSLPFSPDGKTLASGNGCNVVKLWNISTGKWTTLLDEDSQYAAPLVVFSPDGKSLASGGACMREIKLWHVAKGNKPATLEGYDLWGITALSFNSNGKTLASMGWHDGLKLWEVATGKLKSAIKIEDSPSAAFSPDCETLATGTWHDVDDEDGRIVVKKPGYVKLWEVATGKELATLKGHTHSVNAVAFSPNGKLLASAEWGRKNTIKLWDVVARKELATLDGHAERVLNLAFSPDGKTLASASEDKTIKLWDVNPKK